MSSKDRKTEIIKLLKDKKYVTVAFLSSHLFLSESTIRRDLANLEKEGYIKRTNGGALYIKEYYNEHPFAYKSKINSEQKKYISNLAIDFVSDFQTIFMDSSSTCSYLARKMVFMDNITVLCNGLSTCKLISENEKINVFCPSGNIIAQSGSIVG